MADYTVVYWPGFLGRSEPAILMLEDAGASYKLNNDVAGFLKSNTGYPAFACPVVTKGEGVVVAQSLAIAAFLGKELGYAPTPENEIPALQLALNIDDVSTEAWKAKTTAEDKAAFISDRLPKWLDTLEGCLAAKGGQGPFALGASPVYTDFLLVSLYGLLAFFFGDPFVQQFQGRSRLSALVSALEARPKIAAFRQRNIIKLPDSFK